MSSLPVKFAFGVKVISLPVTRAVPLAPALTR
jgi:hypothetical protein